MNNNLFIKSEKWRVLTGILILFFTVFSINFSFMSIKPRIITMLFVILVYLLKKREAFRMHDILWVSMSLMIFLYTVLITLASGILKYNIETAIGASFNFFLLVSIFPIIVKQFFKDDIEFSNCLMYATLVHSFIVITSFISPDFRLYLQNIQEIDFSRYNFRIIGLGIAGAGGSVYLVLGLISTVYLIKFSKPKKANYLFVFIIFISILLVGRTGLYVAVIFIMYLFINKRGNLFIWIKERAKILLICIVVIYAIIFGLKKIEVNMELLTYTVTRSFEILQNSSTVDALSEMKTTLPPLEKNFFGTGIVRGKVHGYNVQHDGGYAKRYSSIGILGLILSYGSLILYIVILNKRTQKGKRIFIYLCLALLLAIEYKEPFIYMLAYPFVIIMLSKLQLKNEENKEQF